MGTILIHHCITCMMYYLYDRLFILLKISLALELKLDVVFSSMLPLVPKHKTQMNLWWLQNKVLVWCMKYMQCMYAWCMCYATSNKYRSNIQVKFNIHPSSIIPPTHVFNGEFLFLGFLVWASIPTGNIKNRWACQSLKAIKHRNSISRYKSLAQSLLAQDGIAQMGF